MRPSFSYLLLILLLASCDGLGPEHNIGHFPEVVTNFSELNSEYDDYNSNSPVRFNERYLHFSSNRNTQGANFDIVGDKVTIAWDVRDGKFTISTSEVYSIERKLRKLNTEGNEFGPYSLYFDDYVQDVGYKSTDLLLYSSDMDGNSDIKFVFTQTQRFTNSSAAETIESEIQSLDIINTDAEELYPSFYGEKMFPDDVSPRIEKMLFCSNAEGSFDLFEIDLSDAWIQNGGQLVSVLSSKVLFPRTKLTINSDKDEKCPVVVNNLMVFASNRDGGFGGYDLYYSLFQDGKWSEPVNFGENINTSADEFRPIVIYDPGYDNHMMIFSSNRAGGMGGFDLYYRGIPKLIEDNF